MISWFTRHPVAANLLMLSLLIGGLLSLLQMRKEIIPKLPVSTVIVSASFPGRTAEQVDQALAQKLENAIEGINGIERFTSDSSQGYVQLTVKKQLDYSIDRLLADIKSAVDNIYDWPQEATRPQIVREEATFDALMVQVSGQVDKKTLAIAAEKVKKALLTNPKIHQLKTYGLDESRIYIDINADKMRMYDLSFYQIQEQIRQQSVKSKSGLLKTQRGQLLIYAEQSAQQLAEFEQLIVKVTEQGQLITLRDVASISDGYEEHDSTVTYNGMPTVGFAIKMTAQSDVLAISEQAHVVVDELSRQLPDNISVDIWFDSSIYVGERLSLLQTNAWQGFVLVFLLLTLFLHIKLAFWVAMGLPIAIAGTFIVLGELGFAYTLNEITTFGFILVLGILVDDAVVVGESVYSAKQRMGNSIESTIAGVKQVALPTTLGMLTSIAALLPMTKFPSETGRIFASFAWVVIIALSFSLIESKLILPAHLRDIKITDDTGMWQKVRQWPEKLLFLVRDRLYQPVLVHCLRYRYACMVLFVSLALLIFGYLANGKIRSVMFPDITSDLIVLTVKLESNAPLALVQKAYQQVEHAQQTLNKNYKERYALSGDVIEKSMAVMFESGEILVFAEPLAREQRKDINLRTLANLWRVQLEAIEAVESVEVIVSIDADNNATEFVIQHPDNKILNLLNDKVSHWLKSQPGVLAVKDNQDAQMPQLNFKLKQAAQLYGLTPRMLAEQLAAAYGGLEVDRFYRDGREVQVHLRAPREERDSISDLSLLYIYNQQGQAIPLIEVADVTTGQVNNSISRINTVLSRKLVMQLDKNLITGPELLNRFEQQMLGKLQQEYPELIVVGAGELQQTEKTNKGLITAFIIASLAIYVLLALALKRYDQPLIIMAAIPFGLIGAILGHVYLQLPVSLYSWLGMLTLSGIVVNDSLLVVARYNALCQQGAAKTHALVNACQSRFRAVVLTSATTFIGLVPLLTETSEQAQYLIPAVVSMAYGLLFATVITLFLIPLCLYIGNEVKAFLTRKQWPTTLDENSSGALADVSIDISQ